MVEKFIYHHLALFFEVIERAAAAGRTKRLCFQGAEGQTVGSLTLDGGMIRFGVEFVGSPYFDTAFSRGAMPYSLPLIKLLKGEKLSAEESLLLAKLPLNARRATRAATARALRLVASLCDLSRPPRVVTDVGSQLNQSSLRISFSPLELMLAAGTSGDIRYEDAAASEYELPPGNPKERWLFEWHGEHPRSLWPVMTTRLSERKVSTVLDIGQFGQHLVSSLEPLIPATGRSERTAALITTGDQIHYVVQSERYVALLTYAVEQGARLRVTLENMAERGKGLTANIHNHSSIPSAISLSNISPIGNASSISDTSSISNASGISSVSSLSSVPSMMSGSPGSGPIAIAAPAEQPEADVPTADVRRVVPASATVIEVLDPVSAEWIELQETARDLVGGPPSGVAHRPSAASASSPPVTASASSPPVTASASSPPVTASASSPPVTASASSPPVTASASSPPVTASASSPPVTASASSPPVTASASSPPVLESVQVNKEYFDKYPDTHQEQQQKIEQNERQEIATQTADQTHTEKAMALTSNTIKELLTKLETGIEGFIGAAIADSESGMCLGTTGGGGIMNMEVAAASNTEVVRSKRKAIKTLGLRDEIEDILITLGKQYHLIRPLRSRSSVFIYIALDRTRANLGLARYTLTESERDIVG